jgi:hypothetical protein
LSGDLKFERIAKRASEVVNKAARLIGEDNLVRKVEILRDSVPVLLIAGIHVAVFSRKKG